LYITNIVMFLPAFSMCWST